MEQSPIVTNIKFYYMPESPPCRTVEMVAAMVNINLDRKYVNLYTKENLQADHIKLNPWQKVPFIVDGELKINESRAIAAYLVNRYQPNNETLYPNDPVKRARVDELLYLDMNVANQASKLFYPKFFVPSKMLDSEAERVYRQYLKYFDNRLKANRGTKFMLGDELTIADISIAANLTLAEACEFDMSSYSALESYLERMKNSIPMYKEINEKPIERTKNYIRSIQEKSSSNSNIILL